MSNTDKRAWVDNSLYAVKNTATIEKMVQAMLKKASFVFMDTPCCRKDALVSKAGMFMTGSLYLNHNNELVFRNFPNQKKSDPDYWPVPASKTMNLAALSHNSVDQILVIDSLQFKDRPEIHSVESLWKRLPSMNKSVSHSDIWERVEVYLLDKSGNRITSWTLLDDQTPHDPRPVDWSVQPRRAAPERGGMMTPLDHMAREMNGLNTRKRYIVR